MRLEKAKSFNTMKKAQQTLNDKFKQTLSFDFNILEFAEDLGREHALPHLTINLIENLPNRQQNFGEFNENRLVLFLNEIQKGYSTKVQYHNDLHGADVA